MQWHSLEEVRQTCQHSENISIARWRQGYSPSDSASRTKVRKCTEILMYLQQREVSPREGHYCSVRTFRKNWWITPPARNKGLRGNMLSFFLLLLLKHIFIQHILIIFFPLPQFLTSSPPPFPPNFLFFPFSLSLSLSISSCLPNSHSVKKKKLENQNKQR